MRRPRRRGPPPGRSKEYLLEFVPSGNSVKVSAIDPETGVEVSIVGPLNGGEELLSQTAVNKLKYVLKKRQAEAEKKRRGITI